MLRNTTRSNYRPLRALVTEVAEREDSLGGISREWFKNFTHSLT